MKWEDDMKRYEIYSNTEIPPGSAFAVRVDGRSFHKEVERMALSRPLDRKLRDAMVEAATAVMKDFLLPLAYTESDEATFLFPKEYAGFNRRPEKIASLVAARMSVAFNNTPLVKGTKVEPIFDARVLVLPTEKDVDRCFKWRIGDSKRNCVSTYCFWTMVNNGVKKSKAQKIMDGMKDAEKLQYLKMRGINYDKITDWERHGTVIKRVPYAKAGYDPIAKVAVVATRYKFVATDGCLIWRALS